MKIKARQTSIESYHSLKNLPKRRKEVYETLVSLKYASNLDIAGYLKLPINQITPRTNELVKIGLVEEAYRNIHPVTKRKVIFWKIKQEQEKLW